MELTKYFVLGRPQWIDLYGTPYKKCCKCGNVKPDYELCKDNKDSLGLMGFCKDCQKIKDKSRMLNPIEVIKAKERINRFNIKKLVKKIPRTLISAPKTNIMLCHCEITGKDFYSRMSKLIPIVHPKCEIKGDYSTPKLLAKATLKHGRFHSCSHCSKQIDLILSGFIQTACNADAKLYLPFCSESCRDNHTKQTITESHRRRRARKRTGIIETIRPEQIYIRDKYKCWICGCKVVSTYGKDSCINKDAATLDHVIPLAKGGTHTKDNLKTACRQCNSIKSDNIIQGTQINIFTYASV